MTMISCFTGFATVTGGGGGGACGASPQLESAQRIEVAAMKRTESAMLIMAIPVEGSY
jgi:hypothetical protein